MFRKVSIGFLVVLLIGLMAIPVIATEQKGLIKEDFGVHGGATVDGYNLGWRFSSADVLENVQSVTARLLDENGNVLYELTSGNKQGIQQSAPFDLYASYDYVNDIGDEDLPFWTVEKAWQGAFYQVPAKAQVEVLYRGGIIETATWDNAPVVDGNPALAFPSVQDAINKVGLGGYNHIPATITGTLNLTGHRFGLNSAININSPITIIGGIVDSAIHSGSNHAINVIGDDVTIQGMKIFNTDTSHGINITGQNATIDSVEITNTPVNGHVAIGVWNHGATIINNTITRGAVGIGGGLTGVTLSNNTITDAMDEGIWISSSETIGSYMIDGNHITNSGKASIKIMSESTVNTVTGLSAVRNSLFNENPNIQSVQLWGTTEILLPITSDSKVLWIFPVGILLLAVGALGYKKLNLQIR